VIAIPANAARIAAILIARRLISRTALARDIKFFKAFIRAPRCELASERGEYSKAARLISLCRRFRVPAFFVISNFQFLFSDFHFLSLQLHDGDRLSAMLLGLK